MTRIITAVLFAALLVPGVSPAMQVVTPVEGVTTFVEISQKDLNVIKTGLSGLKAMSSSTRIDVKVEGKTLFVKYLGGTLQEPQELILMGENGETYPLVLKPSGIPSETIVLRLREDGAEAMKWEASQGQVKAVKELMKAMYLGIPPRGYMVEETSEDRTEWNEVRRTLTQRFGGATLTGEVHTLRAVSKVILDEREFHRDGILAVSLDRHQLEPEETAKLYIVAWKRGR